MKRPTLNQNNSKRAKKARSKRVRKRKRKRRRRRNESLILNAFFENYCFSQNKLK
jgi:hypothetical protein